MNHQEVVVRHVCEDCGSAGPATVVHSIRNNEATFSMSFRCTHCGHAVEYDGLGLPDEARSLAYESYGEWACELVPTSGLSSVAGRAHAVRRALDVPLEQALCIARSSENHRLLVGTWPEAKAEAERVSHEGLDAVVVRV